MYVKFFSSSRYFSLVLRVGNVYSGDRSVGLPNSIRKPKRGDYAWAGTKFYPDVPQLTLCGAPLHKVNKFKYLGHWVTEDLSDNLDIERERRALSVRCNMLARRFARCTKQVKAALFRAYCQSFYTCTLWVKYSQKAYNALRVQYNNAFRILMGLPRFCSASGMFAEARIDGFHAIVRKRCASTLCRIRASPNRILSGIAERWEGPIMKHWLRLHAPVPYEPGHRP